MGYEKKISRKEKERNHENRFYPLFPSFRCGSFLCLFLFSVNGYVIFQLLLNESAFLLDFVVKDAVVFAVVDRHIQQVHSWGVVTLFE